MRVISGRSRGKKLIAVEQESTRPTLDRVKESLFNKLQGEIQDSIVLDLFAGTGALGIEALSRGAKEAVFVDNHVEAVKVIKKNIENTKNLDKSIVINNDYNLALKKLSDENKKFNIVFLDPPYKSNLAYQALQKIIMSDLLTEDGTVIIETDDIKKEEEILNVQGIEIFDKRKYGSVWLIFIRKG